MCIRDSWEAAHTGDGAPNPASDTGASTLLSRLWRSIECKARHAIRIAFGTTHAKYKEVEYLTAIARNMHSLQATLPSNIRRHNAPTISGWCLAFWRAMATRKLFTARSLADMAGAKARKIDSATLNLRLSLIHI